MRQGSRASFSFDGERAAKYPGLLTNTNCGAVQAIRTWILMLSTGTELRRASWLMQQVCEKRCRKSTDCRLKKRKINPESRGGRCDDSVNAGDQSQVFATPAAVFLRSCINLKLLNTSRCSYLQGWSRSFLWMDVALPLVSTGEMRDCLEDCEATVVAFFVFASVDQSELRCWCIHRQLSQARDAQRCASLRPHASDGQKLRRKRGTVGKHDGKPHQTACRRTLWGRVTSSTFCRYGPLFARAGKGLPQDGSSMGC